MFVPVFWKYYDILFQPLGFCYLNYKYIPTTSQLIGKFQRNMCDGKLRLHILNISSLILYPCTYVTYSCDKKSWNSVNFFYRII